MRKDPINKDADSTYRVHGSKEGASFQVIILGPSGGPREDTVTGLLVRAPQTEWGKRSVIAVDAGALLAAVIKILERYMPHRSDKVAEPGYSKLLADGPFAGVRFPFISAKANALHVFRELLHSVLITHPHLDHLAAMAVNTPALEYGREAKAIVALPPVIEAIKTHIFNDSIWPNLSDENHGAGFVTYRRLTEGGNPRLGSGDARGYVSVCDGLATKCLAVTHGKCNRRNHSFSHQRGDSGGWFTNDYNFPSRRMSRMSDDHSYVAAIAQQQAYSNPNGPMQIPPPPMTPGLGGGTGSVVDKDHHHEPVTSSAFFLRNDYTGKEILVFGDLEPDTVSMYPRNYLVWEEAALRIANGLLKAIFIECSFSDATRDADLFGHLCPRHLIAELDSLARIVMAYREKKSETQSKSSAHMPQIAQITLKEPPSADLRRKRKRGLKGDAADVDTASSPKLQAKKNADSSSQEYVGKRPITQSDRRTSRDMSTAKIQPTASGKSPMQHSTTPSRLPRHVQFHGPPQPQSHAHSHGTYTGTEPGITAANVNPATAMTAPQPQAMPPTTTQLAEHTEPEVLPAPLEGITVYIIHVKDTMVDGPSPGELIGKELRSRSEKINLGCEFDVTDSGESIWI